MKYAMTSKAGWNIVTFLNGADSSILLGLIERLLREKGVDIEFVDVEPERDRDTIRFNLQLNKELV